jgi:ABC-type oligopeptide transport system substrate-binding subunit
MRFLITFMASAILLLMIPSFARAEKMYGLAMHGIPKYSPDFEYIDYVNPNAPKGGTITMSAIGTFDSLNPFAIKGKPAQGLNLYYDRLMTRVWDEPFTMYPLIAQSVEVPDDRSEITIYLNPNAKFHDGSPITADDVLFSFQTLKEYGRPNMRRIYKLVTEATRIDEATINFKFGEGYDQETVMIIVLMPVLSKSWWQDRNFDSTTLEIPLGSGPYRIAEVDPGKRIIMERDPDYWAADLPINRGHFNFDRIIYDYYRDDTVAFEAFKAGDIDLRREWNAGRWASAYDFHSLDKGEVIMEDLEHGRPERVRSFIFNIRRAPFDDIRIRRALNYVLDFDWINQNLFHGRYKRINSYYPNSMLAAPAGAPEGLELSILEPWSPSLPAEVFGPLWTPPATANQSEQRSNLRKASELLKEAGWIIEDGKRVNENSGKPFSFEIILDSPENEKIALSFVQSLKKLGIEAGVRVLDTAAYRGRLSEYDFDMTLYFWQNSLSPGTEQLLFWGCEAAEQPSRWNYPGICHPAVDAISKSIANAKSREDLVVSTHALDRILIWGHYTIPLYYAGKDFVSYKADIKRPDITPLYGMVLESWWHKNHENGD